MSSNWLRCAIVASATAIFITGCALAPSKSYDEQNVRELAQRRWTALLADDPDTAYGFFTEGSRALVSLKDYRFKVPRNFWTAAEVESVTCEQDRCEVRTELRYKMAPRAVEVEGHGVVTEKWLREGGAWRYVYVP